MTRPGGVPERRMPSTHLSLDYHLVSPKTALPGLARSGAEGLGIPEQIGGVAKGSKSRRVEKSKSLKKL